MHYAFWKFLLNDPNCLCKFWAGIRVVPWCTGIIQILIVHSPGRCKCRIGVLFISAQKIKRAATRYHKIKTVRLEREFFVPTSTSIAALTPARLIHKSSPLDSCTPRRRPAFDKEYYTEKV